MNTNIFYIFYVILFSIIIIILLHIIQNKNNNINNNVNNNINNNVNNNINNKELFSNNLLPNKECSREFIKNSFCQYNYNDEKCECIYQKDDIKLGNNNKFWKISNGKWAEINEDVINKKIIILNNNKFIKYINNIPQIGEINNKPIFIKNYDYNNKTKSLIIDFIGIENTITELIKYIKYL